MRRSLPTYLACLVAGLLVAWSSRPAQAASSSAAVGDECLEFVSTPALECTRSADDSEALCEPATLMSVGTGESLRGTVHIASDPELVEWRLMSAAAIASEHSAARRADDAASDLETIRICPPGTAPQGDTCRVRAPYDTPPGQGSGAPSPQLDPWLLHSVDSTRPVRGRPVAFAGLAPVVHPGYARVPDRPPQA